LNSRQIRILELLIEQDGPVTSSDLAKQFCVSLRSIQSDVTAINYDLKRQGLPLVSSSRKEGLLLELLPGELRMINQFIYKQQRDRSVLSPKERLEVLYSIFLFNQDHITLSKLAERLEVSRSTIVNDLKYLRNELKSFSIFLVSSPLYGMILSGDEKIIRGIAIEHYMENVDVVCLGGAGNYYKASLCNRFMQVKTLEETKLVYEILQSSSIIVDNDLTDYSFLKIISSLELAIERIKTGNIVVVNSLQMERIYNTYEFIKMHHLVDTLSEELGIVFPIEEIIFLTIELLGSSRMNKDLISINENYAEIQMIVCDLIQGVGDRLGMDIAGDISLYNSLMHHLRPAVFRIRNKIRQKNPLIDEIHKKYQEVYDAVAESAEFMEQMMATDLSENEIGFITLHFVSTIEKQQSRVKIIPNVLIVCESGIGTSHLLATRLAALYDINILDIISFYEFEDALEKHQIDYVVSTLNLKSCNRLFIKVNPFVSENDKEQLDKYFSRKGKKVEIDQEKFLQILEKNCTIKNKKGLLTELTDEFSLIFHNTRKEKELMLKDVITKNMIELDYHASDWEDAVRRAGKLLMEEDCIEQSYIESMVNTVKTVGAYIVIAKGIALPHSRSGDGAHKVGISVLRLAKPVVFGHEENDPVDLLFGLSSTDNKSHLGALKDMVNFLSDETNIEFLRKSSTIEEVYNCLLAGEE